MQCSMSALESIQKLLNITATSTEVQEEANNTPLSLSQMKIELIDTSQSLQKKTALLDKAHIQVEELSKSLDTLSVKYNSDMSAWNKRYSDTKENLKELHRECDVLSKKNNELEDMIHQLEEFNKSESQRKDLLLRESSQEQKLLTQGVLERDGEINSLKNTVEQLKSDLEEKTERLNLTQGNTEECFLLQEKVLQLEEENTRCRKRLENLNELYQHKQAQDHGSEDSMPNGTDNSDGDVLEVKTEWIESNSIDNGSQLKQHKSRIPILSGSMSKSTTTQVTTEQMDMMKEDLLLYQEKLIEKITQNRELENAVERMNEHCALLRNSIHITREESADRYRKMIKYMEENRRLKERLQEFDPC
ncbi:unnamed protein product [Mucor hiemalis]